MGKYINDPNDYVLFLSFQIIGISLFVVQIAQEVVEYTFSYFRNQVSTLNNLCMMK